LRHCYLPSRNASSLGLCLVERLNSTLSGLVRLSVRLCRRRAAEFDNAALLSPAWRAVRMSAALLRATAIAAEHRVVRIEGGGTFEDGDRLPHLDERAAVITRVRIVLVGGAAGDGGACPNLSSNAICVETV
jgi:hypothetical protein